MPALVQRDRRKAGRLPRCLRPVGQCAWPEGSGAGAEDEAVASTGAETVLDERLAQHGGYRHGPRPDVAFRSDLPHLVIPRATHTNDVVPQVDVFPPKRHQLATAEAGV